MTTTSKNITSKMTNDFTLTLVEASRLIRRTGVYTRRLVSDGTIKAKKNESGEWRVSRASCEAYKAQAAAKEAARLKRIDDGVTYTYNRPRVDALKKVRAELEFFSKDERQVVETVLDAIEKKWNAEYEKRKTTKK